MNQQRQQAAEPRDEGAFPSMRHLEVATALHHRRIAREMAQRGEHGLARIWRSIVTDHRLRARREREIELFGRVASRGAL